MNGPIHEVPRSRRRLVRRCKKTDRYPCGGPSEWDLDETLVDGVAQRDSRPIPNLRSQLAVFPQRGFA